MDNTKYLENLRDEFTSFEPRLYTSASDHRRSEIQGMLPKGASLAPRTATSYMGGVLPEGTSLYGGGSGGGAQYHIQRPYIPEFETPDRQQFPQERKRANFLWRMFHKYDPVFGTALDMYSEMLASTFDINVPDDDSKEIRDTLEAMVQQVNLVEALKYFVCEYLCVGEAIPHCYWDDDEGIWTYIGFHNPDSIDVRSAPIVNADPVISYIPDDSLRLLLTDSSPESFEFRKRLPAEFVAKVMSRQKIRLSNLNCTFVPRKLHPYDIRGTSLATRLWRIFMVEDAVYAATIATYRRNAGPIRCIKLGDASQGWIASPDQESKLLDLLARAEMDPNAFLIWNYGINYEAWGSNDRVITIDKLADTIEKLKLIGLNLSKGFMVGETSYAATKGGLQVFLRRLLSLRQFIESVWLYPKVFKPVAQMNGWTKARPSEVNHRYRIKRTAQEIEDDKYLIMPELMWHNKLDSKLDNDLLQAFKVLESLGLKISKAKIASAAGLDWKEEYENGLKEFMDEDNLQSNVLGETYKEKFNEQNQKAKPPGTAGGGALPPGAAGGAKKAPGEKAGPGGADKAVPLNDSLEGPGESAMPNTIE